jgi:hypothetical protein
MKVSQQIKRAFDLFAQVHATPGYAAHLSFLVFLFHVVLVHLVMIVRHIAGSGAVYDC